VQGEALLRGEDYSIHLSRMYDGGLGLRARRGSADGPTGAAVLAHEGALRGREVRRERCGARTDGRRPTSACIRWWSRRGAPGRCRGVRSRSGTTCFGAALFDQVLLEFLQLKCIEVFVP
jgi:hypothetical protein